MSLGEVSQVSEDVYAYLQPDGSWFLNVLAYLRFVQDTARQGRAAGLSPLEAARTADLGPFKDLYDSERIVGNLHRAYCELDGAERGRPSRRRPRPRRHGGLQWRPSP